MYQIAVITFSIENLPSFGSCNLQRETLAPDKVYVVVENATKVNKVVGVDRLNSIADLLLQLSYGMLIVASIDSCILCFLVLALSKLSISV